MRRCWPPCALILLSLIWLALQSSLAESSSLPLFHAPASSHVVSDQYSASHDNGRSPHPRAYAGHVSAPNASVDVAALRLNFSMLVSADCVTLDALHPAVIRAVTCEQDAVTLEWVLPNNASAAQCADEWGGAVSAMHVCTAASAAAQWQSNRTALNGGVVFGCVDERGLETVLMRRVLHVAVLDDFTALVTTAESSVLACVDDLKMRLHLNHTRPLSARRSRQPAAPVVDERVRDVNATQGVAFFNASAVGTPRWSASSRFHTESVGPMATLGQHRFHPNGASFSFYRITPTTSVLPDTGVLVGLQFFWSGLTHTAIVITVYLFNEEGSTGHSWSCALSSQCWFNLPLNLGNLLSDSYYFDADWSAACDPSGCIYGFCASSARNNCPDAQDSAGSFQIYLARSNSYNVPHDLLDWSCSQCAFSTPQKGLVAAAPPSYACTLCAQGFNLNAALQCTNCYLDYTYSVYDFDLDVLGGTLSLSLEGAADFNLQLQLLLSLQYQQQSQVSLPNLASLLGSSFTIANVNFQLVLHLDLALTSNITADLSTALTTGVNGSLTFGRTFEFSQTNGASGYSWVNVVRHYYDTSLQAQGMLDVQVGLLPNLTASFFGIVQASIGVEAYAELQVEFSASSLPALPSSAVASCRSPHLVEFGVYLGIRNDRVTGLINIDLNLLLVHLRWQYFVQVDDFAHIAGRGQLLDACALLTSGQSPVVWSLPLRVTVSASSAQQTATLLLDISHALQLPLTRFVLLGSTAAQGRRRLLSGSTVSVQILPSDDPAQPQPQANEAACRWRR